MAFSLVSSNLTSGFIDLATFDELEKYMYGSGQSITYFVRETRKATWFTQVPTVLQRSSGTADFNQEWSANITRAGDYLLQLWIRFDIPAITATVQNTTTGVRWTRNLAHNLIREASVTFNDLQAARLDSYFLDFWAAFTTPAGKQVGYNNMIGNTSALFNPTAPGVQKPGATLNLPLPFFFTRDSGVALPTAALPYNDMKIQVWFRDWTQLIIIDNSNAAAGTNPSRAPVAGDLVGTPALSNVYMWSNYCIVSNAERKRMGCAPRDILVEQVQTAPIQTFAPATNANPSYDIRFSHAIKALFFAIRNTTTSSEWSNYTISSPVPLAGPNIQFTPPAPSATDPISNASLIYENTARLSFMGADFFSLVQPYFQPNAVIPTVTGYHLYSYSLDFLHPDPKGSTNYGKLTNVSVVPSATTDAVQAANGQGLAGSGYDYPQTFSIIVIGYNYNVIRISGGALGFPVL